MSSEKPGKRTITLEIDALDFEAIDRADVGQILRDALGEFLATRGVHKGSEAGKPCVVSAAETAPYVASRYPEQSERTGGSRFVALRDKAREVAKRCAAAMALRRAAVTLHAHDEPLDPDLDEVGHEVGHERRPEAPAPTTEGAPSTSAAVGQEREGPDGARVKLVGCYGFGSEGDLFAFEQAGVLAPNGISKASVERDYPIVVREVSKLKRELLVRKLVDREIVRRIDVGDRGPRAVEKIMLGLLRNMDTNKFFIDDSACT